MEPPNGGGAARVVERDVQQVIIVVPPLPVPVGATGTGAVRREPHFAAASPHPQRSVVAFTGEGAAEVVVVKAVDKPWPSGSGGSAGNRMHSHLDAAAKKLQIQNNFKIECAHSSLHALRFAM